jgi:hypothetical protein
MAYTPSSSLESPNQTLDAMGGWTLAEEEALVKWVQIHGKEDWRGVTQIFPGRSFRECHHHWHVCRSRLDRPPRHQKRENKWRQIPDSDDLSFLEIATFDWIVTDGLENPFEA